MTNKSKVIDGIQHKQCSICKKFKPLDEFHKLKHGVLGLTNGCKECVSIRAAEWRKAHPEYMENRKTIENSRYKND